MAGLIGSPSAVADATLIPANVSRIEQSFDEHWRFHRGDASGAEGTVFDDSDWRSLDVPHDWRIEDLLYVSSSDGGASAEPAVFSTSVDTNAARQIGPFDATADLVPDVPDVDVIYPGLGHLVIPGGRSQGYTVAGIGWYRKHFTVTKLIGSDKQLAEVRFDGVYRNCDVWVNGVHLGFHPNGYTSFAYDLTPHLRLDGGNVLAVRVDNRGKSSRWYSGSGIYRHTWLTVTGPVRIRLWGVRVTTPVVDEARSTVRGEVQLSNAAASTRVNLRMTVLDSQGRRIATETTPVKTLAAGGTDTHTTDIAVANAALWSPLAPNLYRLVVDVLLDDKAVDSVTTTFWNPVAYLQWN